MKFDDINRLNLDNLTSLWRKMGVRKNSILSMDELYGSVNWPHRFWFENYPSNESLIQFESILPELPAFAVVPVWDSNSKTTSELESILRENHFSILFAQLAMYLELEKDLQFNSHLQKMKRLTSVCEVPVWTETAGKAFGYKIDDASIESLISEENIHLLLIEVNNLPAGTALVYKTGEIVGVHLVGVITEHRGKGIARSIMEYVIQLAIEIGGRYLTLQASSAGEPLYHSLGFKDQFWIKNYRR